MASTTASDDDPKNHDDTIICQAWLEENQKRLPTVLTEHLQWVSDKTNQFQDAVIETPPTMQEIKDRLMKGRLKRMKNSGDNGRNEMSSAAAKVAMRKPTMLPVKNPLRMEELQRMLSNSDDDDNSNNDIITPNDVQHLCEAVQGYHPGALKAPLENWLFDSFLCTAERVLPNLWLGGFVPAHDQETIHKIKVTHVLCVGGKALSFGEDQYNPPFPSQLTYKLIDVDDTEKAADVDALGKCFPEAVAYIDNCLNQKQTPLLVHCMAGVSRSASVVCAYLIWKYQLSVEDALRLVRSARPIATPNAAFVAQLEEWHKTAIEKVSEKNS